MFAKKKKSSAFSFLDHRVIRWHAHAEAGHGQPSVREGHV